MPTPRENDMFKRLGRRCRALVDKRAVFKSVFRAIFAVCPDLLDITNNAKNISFYALSSALMN